MIRPRRLLDSPELLSSEERRALRAGRKDRPPRIVHAATWTGIAAQVGLAGKTAAAVTPLGGSSVSHGAGSSMRTANRLWT